MRAGLFAVVPTILMIMGCSDGASSSAGGGGSSTGGTGGTAGQSGTTGVGGNSGGSTGSGGTTTTNPTGESVTLRAEPCSKIPPQSSKCESFEVECEGLAPAIVDIATYEPTGVGSAKGTILFGSGGEGTGFYNFTQMGKLLNAGYRVVDRRWPDGWFTGGTDGPQQTACRLAAVIRHLRATVASEGLLCATGNSGGSAELGYALTWQGAGASLDFAMPTSGPFHRLDLACQGAADATWPTECLDIVASVCPDCATNQCQLNNGPRSLIDKSFGPTPKCSAPADGDLEFLKARSPELGPDVPGLGDLPIRFMIGKLDMGAYAPLTSELHDALLTAGANVEIAFIDGAEHEMEKTTPGANAITEGLLANCVP
ncbi:MAG: hypothetical protein IPK82_34110 [Polyangiaceae bacterium]|nr:hypothetical protein [Polyangiaceae bacterium]